MMRVNVKVSYKRIFDGSYIITDSGELYKKLYHFKYTKDFKRA